jgi:DNA-binding response OmpR family regulator
MTAYGSVEDAVTAIRHGAVDYLQKPFSAQTLTDKINQYIKVDLNSEIEDPIAQDPKSQALLTMALKVAQSNNILEMYTTFLGDNISSEDALKIAQFYEKAMDYGKAGKYVIYL